MQRVDRETRADPATIITRPGASERRRRAARDPASGASRCRVDSDRSGRALGKNANNSALAGQGVVRDSEADERARRDRATRHDLLDELRAVTSLPRVAKCMRVPRSAAGVTIRYGPDGPAGVSNVCTCGSVWACPVHAAIIGAERAREELEPVIRYVIDRGGSVLHLVLTAQHVAGIPLVKTRKAIQEAWAFLTSHKRWRTMDEEYDLLGFTRGSEAMWGYSNGWHPHLHVLIYLDRKIDDVEAIRYAHLIYDVYRRGLERSGFTCSAQRGVNVSVATTRKDAAGTLSKYVAKISHEVTRHDRKSGGDGRFTPFDLLREFLEQGNADMLDLWHEYEQATFGAKQLTWSGRRKDRPDIRTLAGLRGERTDQEIADQEIGDGDRVVIPSEDWARMSSRRTHLFDAIETGGTTVEARTAAAHAWLDARGIQHHPPPPPSRPWRLDRDTERMILSRSARSILRT